jgi:type VII secretion protein EccB
MATRLEELHGHQYTMQRVANALTRHEPDPGGPRAPRTLTLALVSALIAALLLVGVLVVNLVTGRGTPTELRGSSTVLIEKETGAQYVYVKNDDRLHPVLNYASGLLLTDGYGGQPVVVRRSRLADLRREENLQIGATLGIPDAPNALARTSDLIREPWTVCTQGVSTGTLRSDLLVGVNAVTGGRTLTSPAPGATAEALLVRSPGRQGTFLIFGNRKLELADPAVALAAFGWAGRRGQPVSAAWLNALQQGPDISTPSIAGPGRQSQVVDAPVGQLLRAAGPNGDQWAIVRLNDVRPITEVQARLLQADPAADVGEPVTVDTSDLAKLPLDSSPPAAGEDQLPVTVPTLASISSSVCAQVSDAAAGVTKIIVDPAASTSAAATPRTGTPDESGAAVADRVSVPFGRGVLVRAVPSPTAPTTTGTLSIVTDNGIRYAIADSDALSKLGYANATPQNMPAQLVGLLPQGPALSTAAAKTAG